MVQMNDMRCRCGKLLCQFNGEVVEDASVEEVGDNIILIKCRYCKRFMAIRFTGKVTVEFVDERSELEVGQGRSA